MNIAGRKVAVVLALVAVVTIVFGSLLRADEVMIRDEFRQAINAFEEGDYKQAKIHFAAVLNLNPSMKLAAELRDAATLRYMYDIAQKEEIGADIWRLINLAAQYDREQQRDPENIKKLIVQLDGDAESRKIAVASLVNVGSFAIPFLVPHLADPNEEDGMRTYAYITISKMGLAAVQPLIELLNTKDQLLKKNICLLLANMNDIRPVPYLLKIAKTEGEMPDTRNICAMAIQKLLGKSIAETKPLENYFYNEALRYYIDSAVIMEESYSSYGIIWRWSEEEKGIAPFEVPIFIYNEEVARIRCFDGLSVAPKTPMFTPLLVCLGYSELNEVADKAMMLNQQYGRGLGKDKTEEVEKALTFYRELEMQVRRANIIGHLVGQTNLFMALDLALRNNKFSEIVSITTALAVLSDGSLLPSPGGERTFASSLIDALGSKNARVRYEAAVGLAKINPAKPFEGQDKVALTLAAALGETSDINFLVIDNEIKILNKYIEIIRSAGYGAESAFSGRSGVAKAGVFPIKDIILLDYILDEQGDINTEQVYRMLKDSAHTSNIPVIFMVPRPSLDEFKAKFPGDFPYILTPIDEAAMMKVIREVIEAGNFDNPFRVSVNDIASRAAMALASINPDSTNINLKVAIPALIAAFGSHLDDVRIGAMQTLANLKAGESLEALKGVFKNKENSSQVRVTSLRAIGKIDPTAAKDLLVEAIGDADYEIALEGAKALGQRDFDPETINGLINKSK